MLICLTSEVDERAWDDLADRTAASPFVRPGWVRARMRAFGRGEPAFVTVESAGELRGILPVQRRGASLVSPTNWHNPLFGPLAEDAATRQALLSGVDRAGIHRVELAFVDEQDGQAFATAMRTSGWRSAERRVQRSPYVDTRRSWDEFERGVLSRNRRKDLRRRRRRLEEAGDVAVDIVASDPAGGPLEEFLAVEAAGWKGCAGTAIARSARTPQFYVDVAQWSARRGELQLALLRLDGTAIAGELTLVSGRVRYSLKAGYDERYRQFAPGLLLMSALVQRDCDGDVDVYDQCGGVEDYSWTSRPTPAPGCDSSASAEPRCAGSCWRRSSEAFSNSSREPNSSRMIS